MSRPWQVSFLAFLAICVGLGPAGHTLSAQESASATGQRTVGMSPWGPKDELGRMNLMTRESQARLLHRMGGKPKEVARWVLSLADPEATWVTGQILGVDGGMAVA